MSSYSARSAYWLVIGMLEVVGASIFLSYFTNLMLVASMDYNYYYYYGGEYWWMASLVLIAGLFALLGGILALRRRSPKRVIVFHSTAICFALALSIWLYYSRRTMSYEQPVQGLMLLLIGTFLMAISRSGEDKSETQIFS